MTANQRLYERREKILKSISGINFERYTIVIKNKKEGIRMRIDLVRFKIIP